MNQFVEESISSEEEENLQEEIQFENESSGNEEIEEFTEINKQKLENKKIQYLKVNVPIHRIKSLKENWDKIYTPIVEQNLLQIRYNTSKRDVEIRTSNYTKDINALQRSADFVHAFCLGFEIEDAIAILRLDNLFVDSFNILEVKFSLKGDNLSRAIGRIVGQGGKTKYAIENATKTRIVMAGKMVHILGTFNSVKYARDAVCDLVLGTPPGKVYNKLRVISSRLSERF
ncbi:RNA-binding protein pno1 [Anaeramoeba flamelloides]|uniref:RNA-binding protein pno1 n=1 Tax=Anaeramoeba flamelloides TaxID=1746091 RepID=A0AAV7ZH02_9EUKA|nr:RNA-binding protein pno1 [Anaeramoeba flamelloides]KAJ6244041.1 RNA-binding protein pno1 [Anaeramoeba flamelloides]